VAVSILLLAVVVHGFLYVCQGERINRRSTNARTAARDHLA
jgi:hypothetical protein